MEQLVEALLDAPNLAECVSRSLLTHALQRPLGPEDACSLEWVQAGLAYRMSLSDVILSVITSPAFLHADPT